MAVSAIALAIAACQPLGRAEYSKRLESTFPDLEALRVTEFRDQDWCVNLEYPRGSFSKTTSHSTCDLFLGAASAFDDRATADLQRLLDVFHKAGVDPTYGQIELTPEGKIKAAYFETGCAGCAVGRYIFNSSGADVETSPGEGTSENRLSENWSWYEER